MQDSKQQQTTLSGQKKAGRRLGSVPSNKLPSQLPEMEGRLFGSLLVVSGEIVRKTKGGKPHLLTECTGCLARSLKDYSSLTRLQAGCRACGNPRSAPKWLVMRAIAAKQRCTNSNDPAYARYGARGILFRFESPTAMAVWVQENLGLHKDSELDRINNDGHYEPGNLRYLTRSQNLSNTRKRRINVLFHQFRQAYPAVRYADSTLSHMLGSGMSFEEIAAKFSKKSAKPKGVYGTFSTADPVIASLSKGS